MVPSVSIIIPNFNGRDLLKRFLPSVVSACNAYSGETEIIVADDNSTDDSVDLALSIPTVKVVRRNGTRGFPMTCNDGAKAARHDILFFLNNDVEVEKDFLAPLIPHFTDPTVFAASPKCYSIPGKSFMDSGKIYEFKKGFFKTHRNYDVSNTGMIQGGHLLSFMASGGFSAIRKSMFTELGGFDSVFSPFNWEDADLCYRALARGWNIHYEPRSIVYHMKNTTINKHYKKISVNLITKRNRLILMWKNLHDPGFFIRHFAYLCFWLFLYTCIGNFIEVGAFFMALRHLPHILKERKKNNLHRQRSDKDIENLFQTFMAQDELIIKN
jgi:GT2 family glycosyltransferase